MAFAAMQRWGRSYGLLALFLALQGAFWLETKSIKPEIGVVPDVPGRAAVHALAFGDNEFFFRVLAFNIQNAGDTYGRFTSLRQYDMRKLNHWWTLLDELNPRSNMLPAMACYYFAQTQNVADIRYIVDYLYDHSARDVPKKWWWLMQSIYLAQHKLDDLNLALKVSKPMVNPEVPAFAQQMAAVVREKRGEFEDALVIMETIRDNAKDIRESDLKFMTYFIEERLKRLDEVKGNTTK